MQDGKRWIYYKGRRILVNANGNIEKKDYAIHYGNLGKARDTNFFAINSSKRSTGHFGNGTYFLSKEVADKSEYDKLFTRKDRPRQEIDFNEYDLYKPKTENEALRLHEGLKAINYGDYENYDYKFMKDDLKRNGISEEKIDKAINKVEVRKKELNSNNDFEYQIKQDSLSTTFMKELGYNGIDVRGFEQLDNTGYGSVIYDLSKKRGKK